MEILKVSAPVALTASINAAWIFDMQWKPIEEIAPDEPVWVIQYTLYTNDLGEFCDKDHHEAEPMTDIHGWYESEADAYKVLHHFPKPNSYKVRKAHKRRLL